MVYTQPSILATNKYTYVLSTIPKYSKKHFKWIILQYVNSPTLPLLMDDKLYDFYTVVSNSLHCALVCSRMDIDIGKEGHWACF